MMDEAVGCSGVIMDRGLHTRKKAIEDRASDDTTGGGGRAGLGGQYNTLHPCPARTPRQF